MSEILAEGPQSIAIRSHYVPINNNNNKRCLILKYGTARKELLFQKFKGTVFQSTKFKNKHIVYCGPLKTASSVFFLENKILSHFTRELFCS